MKLMSSLIFPVFLLLSWTASCEPVWGQTFFPSEQVVADAGLDPEFDAVGKQVVFAEPNPNDPRRLLIYTASINADGTFDLNGKEFVGYLVPISTPEATPSNGAEWMYTAGSSSLIWTGWKNDDPGSRTWVIKHARKEAGGWISRTVPCTDHRHSPKGSLNVGDATPFIRYFAGIPGYPRRAIYLRKGYDCRTETVLPGTEDFNMINFQSQILPLRRALVYPLYDPATQRLQVRLYDDESGGSLWLTSSTITHKVYPWLWSLPVAGNEYGMFVLEAEPNLSCPDFLSEPFQAIDCHQLDRLSIYVYVRDADAMIKVRELRSPDPLYPIITSPEPFVFQEKSYLVVKVKRADNSDGQIWILSADGTFTRRVDENKADVQPSDPEPYITEDTVWIYFNRGQRIIRAETGLGQQPDV